MLSLELKVSVPIFLSRIVVTIVSWLLSPPFQSILVHTDELLLPPGRIIEVI